MYKTSRWSARAVEARKMEANDEHCMQSQFSQCRLSSPSSYSCGRRGNFVIGSRIVEWDPRYQVEARLPGAAIMCRFKPGQDKRVKRAYRLGWCLHSPRRIFVVRSRSKSPGKRALTEGRTQTV